jgi:ornithine cyclodeaminase/alanine dehydrogenase-like protein (mu-crystallin family)
MTTVVVVDEAEEQLREINERWSANRQAAPSLVVDELERCVTRLENERSRRSAAF